MVEQQKELQLEGIVLASRYAANKGKQFLGAIIKCTDRMWVIDYDEQSPFHAFADRQVVVSGEPYEPAGQYLIGKKLGHFRVSTMRLVEVPPDAELVEVAAGRHLFGRFERSASDTWGSILTFVTEKGESFPVANDPAGATVGRSVKVWAYPVQSSPSIPGPRQRLWIICPMNSDADLLEWRERHS
jgi:hypothetical protein